MTEMNFFWKGNDFGFLESLVLKSHEKVGHLPIVWLSGERPTTRYWKEVETCVTIKDANEVFNVEDFLHSGGNVRTAASLWRFHFLYNRGGYWCDSDVFAVEQFPDGEWVLCSGEDEPELLSIGVLKAPPHHAIFRTCISEVGREWGNVLTFTRAYRAYFGNTIATHRPRTFYPYSWTQCERLLLDETIPEGCYGVHYWGKALRDFFARRRTAGIGALLRYRRLPLRYSALNESWCERNPTALLARLRRWIADGEAMSQGTAPGAHQQIRSELESHLGLGER